MEIRFSYTSTQSRGVHPSFFGPIKLAGYKIKARLSDEKPDGIFIGLPMRLYFTFEKKIQESISKWEMVTESPIGLQKV